MPSPDELLNDAIAQLPRPHRVKRSAQEVASFPFAIPIEVADLARDAANRRQMSLHSYLRRCVTAFAAFDNGIDFYDLAEDELAVTKPHDKTRGVKAAGHGYGQWQIERLGRER